MALSHRVSTLLALAWLGGGPIARADVPPRPPPPAPVPTAPVNPPANPAPSPDAPPPAAPAAEPAKPVPVAAACPDPTKAGEAKLVTFDFEALAKDALLPTGFVPLDGHWFVGADKGSKAANSVLRQDLTVPEYAAILVTGEGRSFGDATATVRFRPESGDEDATGGIIFRATDPKNYGLVRANANEGNFRLYTVHNGFRRQIASIDIEAPKLMEWHTIAVTFVGNSISATLDGKDKVEATNDTLPPGWCGLWTKADSVTSFDDFRIEPLRKKAEAPANPTGK